MFGFYGNGITLTVKMLYFHCVRQSVTLNKIANDDTPGFKSQYISFENILGEKLKDASAGWRPMKQVEQAINSTRASLHTTRAESTRLDGNNVDMDQEQVDLARTALEYQYMVASIGNDISRLQSAVRSF